MDSNIWSIARRGKQIDARVSSGLTTNDTRTPFEHDYDRLLFCTPVRRLADKTQVFPLDRNDGVRTRLTHSHEVSNLARSIGNRLARHTAAFFGNDLAQAAAPIILAAAGLGQSSRHFFAENFKDTAGRN